MGGFFNGLDYYTRNQGCVTAGGMFEAIIFGAVGGMAIGGMGWATFAYLGSSAGVAGLFGGALNTIFSGGTTFNDMMFDFGVGFAFGVAAYGISGIEAIGVVGRVGLYGVLNIGENDINTYIHAGHSATTDKRITAFWYGILGGAAGEFIGWGVKKGFQKLLNEEQMINIAIRLDRGIGKADRKMAEQILNAHRANPYSRDVVNQVRNQLLEILPQQLPAYQTTARRQTQVTTLLLSTTLADSEFYPFVVGTVKSLYNWTRSF